MKAIAKHSTSGLTDTRTGLAEKWGFQADIEVLKLYVTNHRERASTQSSLGPLPVYRFSNPSRILNDSRSALPSNDTVGVLRQAWHSFQDARQSAAAALIRSLVCVGGDSLATEERVTASPVIENAPIQPTVNLKPARAARYAILAAMLEAWSSEDPSYDSGVMEVLEPSLSQNQLRFAEGMHE
jgi:hypothetical protein